MRHDPTCRLGQLCRNVEPIFGFHVIGINRQFAANPVNAFDHQVGQRRGHRRIDTRASLRFKACKTAGNRLAQQNIGGRKALDVKRQRQHERTAFRLALGTFRQSRQLHRVNPQIVNCQPGAQQRQRRPVNLDSLQQQPGFTLGVAEQHMSDPRGSRQQAVDPVDLDALRRARPQPVQGQRDQPSAGCRGENQNHTRQQNQQRDRKPARHTPDHSRTGFGTFRAGHVRTPALFRRRCRSRDQAAPCSEVLPHQDEAGQTVCCIEDQCRHRT